VGGGGGGGDGGEGGGKEGELGGGKGGRREGGRREGGREDKRGRKWMKGSEGEDGIKEVARGKVCAKSAPLQLTAGDTDLSGGISPVAICSSTLRTVSSLCCGDRRIC